jgi:hypothetical protein
MAAGGGTCAGLTGRATTGGGAAAGGCLAESQAPTARAPSSVRQIDTQYAIRMPFSNNEVPAPEMGL